MDVCDSKMVVLDVYENPVQAEIAKSLLDSADIYCVLHGENMASIYSCIAFPVRLMVRNCDYDTARTLLNIDSY